jgi:uncharacterized protein (TIGR00730 family)
MPIKHPLAYYDPDFLESSDARPVRILSEYLDPMRRFKKHNIQDTVVFFGSARTPSRTNAQRELKKLKDRGPLKTEEYKAALKRSHKAVEWSRYYEDARELAEMLTAWSMALEFDRHRFVVCSGGGPGIMEAANRGASDAGGKSIGLNIKLPFEQAPNKYITPELSLHFHYFFMRKFWFAYLAKALVIFPGGFGTLDEMFELLTLTQTRKLSKKMLVILYGREYWDQILHLEPLAEWGAINEEDLKLLCRVDAVPEAFEHLKTFLTKHHMHPRTQQERKAPGIAKTRS